MGAKVMYDPLYLNPGALNQQITIQAKSTTLASDGTPTDTWTTVATTRASIAAVSSRELYQQQAQTSQISHTIKCRYNPGWSVGPGMRITTDSGHSYVVISAENVLLRNRVLTLSALEINGVA